MVKIKHKTDFGSRYVTNELLNKLIIDGLVIEKVDGFWFVSDSEVRLFT